MLMYTFYVRRRTSLFTALGKILNTKEQRYTSLRQNQTKIFRLKVMPNGQKISNTIEKTKSRKLIQSDSEKFRIILHDLKRAHLFFQDEVKYLSLHLSRNLNFIEHVSNNGKHLGQTFSKMRSVSNRMLLLS